MFSWNFRDTLNALDLFLGSYVPILAVCWALNFLCLPCKIKFGHIRPYPKVSCAPTSPFSRGKCDSKWGKGKCDPCTCWHCLSNRNWRCWPHLEWSFQAPMLCDKFTPAATQKALWTANLETERIQAESRAKSKRVKFKAVLCLQVSKCFKPQIKNTFTILPTDLPDPVI